ncbi:uncharacterized protein LOC128207887 [Mya arenaria]|nr:uncharacterized protein LOC128207887 [Mya arenaria]
MNDVKQFYQSGAFSIKDPNVRPEILPYIQWECRDFCWKFPAVISNLSEIYFTDASQYFDIAWETGVAITNYTFSSKDELDNIRMGLVEIGEGEQLLMDEAYLSMAVRNDTGRPNISPMLNVFPIYRVPLNSSIDIRLFPFDGDGDYVRCHFDTFPGPGSLESHIVLNEVYMKDACVMTLHADSLNFQPGDNLQVYVYGEDFSSIPVQLTGSSTYVSTGPFSRTPLLLSVFVGNSTWSSCAESGPKFLADRTLTPFTNDSYNMYFRNAKFHFKTVSDTDRILVTVPPFMVFHTNALGMMGELDYINDTSMKGIHQVCGQAYSKDGVPGESRCTVLMLDEPDECKVANPCDHGGICENYFKHTVCTYPDGPVYYQNHWLDRKATARIVEPEQDRTAVCVGVPVGLSLLLLLIIVAVTFYLKRYFTDRFTRRTAVEPEKNVEKNDEHKGLRQP